MKVTSTRFVSFDRTVLRIRPHILLLTWHKCLENCINTLKHDRTWVVHSIIRTKNNIKENPVSHSQVQFLLKNKVCESCLAQMYYKNLIFASLPHLPSIKNMYTGFIC